MKNRNLKIIDLHCDTVLSCFVHEESFRNRPGHISTEKLASGGCLAQCFALFIPTYETAEEYGLRKTDPWQLYKDMLSCYRENMEKCADVIRPALSPSDLAENSGGGMMSSLLTVEDGVEIDGKIERLDEMYRDGVRMLALTWNYENCIGYPNSADESLHTSCGLKEFGFEAVQRMNELGMIVDVSHLSEAGFYDVARCSLKPFIASHSCCRALKDHSRNLTDAQLKTIGECGGVVGINFYDVFLGDGNGFTSVDAVISHMRHIKNRAGIESLAWGSDFDGIESTLEFHDYSGFPALLSALEKEFTPDEIDRINSKNFLRVFSEQNCK